MDWIFLGIIVFLFILAVFDITVGVSNDAANFMNSAIGSGAGSFKTVVTVAAIGVFFGALLGNGMMDIARHGVFRPERFAFFDLMCIFMAVMVTDIILIDVFNSLGLPTSTTVSMVFSLLGSAFGVAVVKMATVGGDLGFAELLNTGRALSMILGIFLSVAIAFVFGTVVQFISRMIFTFNYKRGPGFKTGLFGGVAATCIFYFLLIKGVRDMSFMTPEAKEWIGANTTRIVLVAWVALTILMEVLRWFGVNVFRIVVLMGTFSLAMAFAGNDLVNFIGVPLTGFASFQDYMANGSGDAHGYMMGALNAPADTPIYFLLIAGTLMVISLATSKKARHVIKTEVGLGSQSGGDEMFGSSRIARRIVRYSLAFIGFVRDHTPMAVRRFIGRRFNSNEAILESGASFDLVRGSVNLTLAGMLIALGTSLKLPLSTTYVTFMIAMGTSLSDRAWSRESAVFRITGVISVIGGWFITAGLAFISAGLIASVMNVGGNFAIMIVAMIAIYVFIHNNIRFHKKIKNETGDSMFQSILATEDKTQAWGMLQVYINGHHKEFVIFAREKYNEIVQAFATDQARPLRRVEGVLAEHKSLLKTARRKETLCLQHVDRIVAIEKSAWFHLANNSCMSMLYNLRRVSEVCREHVDNNFNRLPAQYEVLLEGVRRDVDSILEEATGLIDSSDEQRINDLRRRCNEIKDHITDAGHRVFADLRDGDRSHMAVLYVFLNLLHESREMVSTLRKLMRASLKLNQEAVATEVAESATEVIEQLEA
jgi:phosphate/sulfate permease